MSTLSKAFSLRIAARTGRDVEKLSDELLIAELQQGHDDALSVLFSRHHRLILNIAYKIVRDQSEAEDVMQRVFFDIYRAAPQFDSKKGSARVWILQYAYRRTFDHLRYLRLRGFYDQEALGSNADSSTRFLADAWARLPLNDSAYLVRQTLKRLTKRQRQAIEMAFFEGLEMTDIAERMKEPVSNIRHHYYRGLCRLRSFLSTDVRASRPSTEGGRR